MSDTTGRMRKIKAVTIACALVYALSALAILATTSTQMRTTSDASGDAVPLAQRLLGR